MNEKKFTEKVEITPEILAELKHHRERTNKASMALLKGRRTELPAGLNAVRIDNWMNGVKIVKKEHLDYVLTLWRGLPDHVARSKKPDTIKKKVSPAVNLSKKLRDHFRKARITPENLLLLQSENPFAVTARQIEGWIHGTINEDNLGAIQYVLNACEDRILAIERVPITQADMELLQAEKERTGYNFKNLVNSSKHRVPDKITATILNQIISRTYETVRKDHLLFFKRSFADLPDASDSIRRSNISRSQNGEITDEILQTLNAYKTEGIHPNTSLDEASNIPDGLTKNIISSWVNGTTKTGNPEYIDFVLLRCEELKYSPARRLIITADMRDELLGQRERTNVSIAQLIASTVPPSDLSENIISSWINGSIDTARKDLYYWTISTWLQLPDKGR